VPITGVQRGGKLLYCAGPWHALTTQCAAASYFNKKKTPGGEALPANLRSGSTIEALKGASRPLAIGRRTCHGIKGANGAGIDALFIADGIQAKKPNHLRPRIFMRSSRKRRCALLGAMRGTIFVWEKTRTVRTSRGP